MEMEIYWIISMSYSAPTTTNDEAGHLGLMMGLRACQQYGWAPLHVTVATEEAAEEAASPGHVLIEPTACRQAQCRNVDASRQRS
ncbi:hypothetical protein GQ600_15953 [Phytophthora cactorum]|nr:hypothetical protein GQ600_15953 [Phytophthora cactorum]